MFWRFLVLGLLVALLDGVAAAPTNCTEGCSLCADECLMCKEGYYRKYGACEECKPNCRTCSRHGTCVFDCTDGWYGLYCSRPCSCSYGICNKYTGTCPYKPDPPVLVWVSSDAEDVAEDVAEYDGSTGIVLIIVACILLSSFAYVCCTSKDEEQMALVNTNIVPPSQKLLPGQVPITMRSTNTTHANSFAGNCEGNSIMCPPRETNIAPPPLATYSGQQTDVALTHCTTNSRQDTDIATAPSATYGGHQTNVGPLPSATYCGHQTDNAPPPCATYCGQQTDIGSSPSASYSGQETDIAPPPSYTQSGQQVDIQLPPSYESLFNSNREHAQE